MVSFIFNDLKKQQQTKKYVYVAFVLNETFGDMNHPHRMYGARTVSG